MQRSRASQPHPQEIRPDRPLRLQARILPPREPSSGRVPLSGIPVLIASKALNGSNHFDIRLDPPELGRIEVRLKVDRDGQVSSHLIADRPDTLALLRRDQTGLERALQDAGLKQTATDCNSRCATKAAMAQPNAALRRADADRVRTIQIQSADAAAARLRRRMPARVGGVDIQV